MAIKTSTASSRPSANATANRPVFEARLGRLKAAVWANSTENGVRHNTTFRRIYKDGEEWKDSDSFGRDDLLLLAKLADKVHTWIYEQAAGNGSREPGSDDVHY
jgi:hypothetical protein